MKQKTPNARLLVATGCQHCPVMMDLLSKHLKQGNLSTLTISNIAVDTDIASELNVRSVPWLQLGSMVLPGLYSPAELEQWVTAAQTDAGILEYVNQFLSDGQLPTIIQAITLNPSLLSSVLSLLADEETIMQVRIGIDAIIEHFAADEVLQKEIPLFIELLESNNPRLQLDALHYLALCAEIKVKPQLESYVTNSNPQLKEAAVEALQTLAELTGS